MGVILAPIPSDKVSAWAAFIEEMNGPRKAEFEEFNRRHALTKHEAWLATTPAGSFVVAIHEGPGAQSLIANVAQSKVDFDVWFAGKLAEVHGMDLTKPPPGPPPECKLSWRA